MLPQPFEQGQHVFDRPNIHFESPLQMEAKMNTLDELLVKVRDARIKSDAAAKVAEQANAAGFAAMGERVAAEKALSDYLETKILGAAA